MTPKELETKINNINKSNNNLNTFVAFCLMAIGIYFSIKSIAFSDTRTEINAFGISITLVLTTIFPISIGLLMLSLIPKQYKVTEIFSKEPIEIKVRLFMKSLSEYKFEVDEFDEIIHIGCKKKYGGIFDVYVFLDNEKYLFNVLTRGSYRSNGPWDARNAKRITKKIKASLQHAVTVIA